MSITERESENPAVIRVAIVTFSAAMSIEPQVERGKYQLLASICNTLYNDIVFGGAQFDIFLYFGKSL